jgi:hypothetical protein
VESLYPVRVPGFFLSGNEDENLRADVSTLFVAGRKYRLR